MSVVAIPGSCEGIAMSSHVSLQGPTCDLCPCLSHDHMLSIYEVETSASECLQMLSARSVFVNQ
jgi:hypothetical protein